MATTSVLHQWKYDAFVSFRGEDIRKGFMGHLYKDFRQKGINAFTDDKNVPRGEEIAPQLYKAIEGSMFLIVIFSKDYASSSWCLKELVKILECKQKATPKYHLQIIFYDVKPTVVRNQTESYAEAFAKHKLVNRTEVAEWKEALTMASNLSGLELKDYANGYEYKLVHKVSKEILEKLFIGHIDVGENIVGLDARLEKMNLSRFAQSTEVNIIGICGVDGIGKTTFAKAIYNRMYIHFDECCFLDDVQAATNRHGQFHVARQLINRIMKTTDLEISNLGEATRVLKRMMESRRILLVLDDVGQHEQLDALAGSYDWFSPGSLIIFTCKNKRLLTNYKAVEIHEMEFLNDAESIELFSLYAFHEKHPAKDFQELANQVVQYVQGHPYALKVLGIFLHKQSMDTWECHLDKLQKYPDADIQQVLRLSFDGLDSVQQSVFLDIASYLVGENEVFAKSILDSCNLYAATSIRYLYDMALISSSRTNTFQMHNLIQIMAREIIREESKKAGGRSRLWIPSEVCHVMNKNEVTEAVEVLVLLLEKSSKKLHMDSESLARMIKLRIFQVCYLELKNYEHTLELNQWNESEVKFELNLWEDSKVKISGSLELLSNELRLFYWHGCPFKLLPTTFYPENIVAIDMSYSRIESLWTTPKCFKKLRLMTLRHCLHLRDTPDFTEITNLEKLNLEGCVNLVEVHPSIGMLKRLVVLNMRNCHSLRSFPCKVEMDSLRVLIITGCSKVDKWPTVLGTIKTLSKHWTSIFQPSSILCKLQHPQRFVLPSFVSSSFLRELNVSYCNISELSPSSFEGLSCLKRLNLSGNSFTSLPVSLSQLSQLETLRVANCNKLEVLPELPPTVVQCFAYGCTSLHKLPKLSINHHKKMHISLSHCQNLVEGDSTKSSVSMLMPPQELNYMGESFDVLFRGNRIPPWIRFQRIGGYIDLKYPEDRCNNKFRGYVACAVFSQCRKSLFGFTAGYQSLNSHVYKAGGEMLQHKRGYMLADEFAVESTRNVGSCLIWLLYSKGNPHWMPKAFDFEWGDLSYLRDKYWVKFCGVRLIWDEDIQEEMDLSTTYLPTPRRDGKRLIWDEYSGAHYKSEYEILKYKDIKDIQEEMVDLPTPPQDGDGRLIWDEDMQKEIEDLPTSIQDGGGRLIWDEDIEKEMEDLLTPAQGGWDEDIKKGMEDLQTRAQGGWDEDIEKEMEDFLTRAQGGWDEDIEKEMDDLLTLAGGRLIWDEVMKICKRKCKGLFGRFSILYG